MSKSFDEFGTLVSVPGFLCRDLVNVIKSHFGRSSAQPGTFHFVPYRHMWKPPTGKPEERIYGELFTGDEWINEHELLQRSSPVEGCTLERSIAAIMIWSDATHLAQYGQSSLWPIYMQFGNRSKDDRSRPSMHLTEHVGYLPKAYIQAKVERALSEKAISESMSTHIDREIFHACWRALLSDNFIEAYRTGLVIDCLDGARRRLYPRIFTYSADYLEKIQVSTIRKFGLIPSPQDLDAKANIHMLGSVSDRRTRINNPRVNDLNSRQLVYDARQKIYQSGYGIGSDAVEALLKPTSSVPTMNAFAERLVEFSFKLYPMLVPDTLYELDLGVCKALLIHLI
ncbi:hypothetical protein BDV93DRAFT_458195 [Ceratobasidium sp. AG-I]|nr:hypothetical protein BDV93DRAFT_458195 [Ceratobasidium sp. AG-I]